MRIKRESPTKAQVFILESLRLDDEKHERFEGRVLRGILNLSEKPAAYYYIRTARELSRLMAVFDSSNFRYLHISCHANSKGMSTTFDSVSFRQLGEILRPHLNHRRLFLSACEMATKDLAIEILEGSDCYSLIGPAETVTFSDAALLWSSFYHLMFKTDESVMRGKWIRTHLKSTATLFGVRMNYFFKRDRKVKCRVFEPEPVVMRASAG